MLTLSRKDYCTEIKKGLPNGGAHKVSEITTYNFNHKIMSNNKTDSERYNPTNTKDTKKYYVDGWEYEPVCRTNNKEASDSSKGQGESLPLNAPG